MRKYLALLVTGLGIIAVLSGCRTRELRLLHPDRDIGLARPGDIVESAAESAPTPQPTTTEVIVDVETNLGNVTLALDPARSPDTVENFVQYVEDRFYDGTIFHRVIPGFMVQGGGFTIDMQQKETRGPIRNESHNNLRNQRGTIAMARRDPVDSATSQFFINLADNPFLDHDGPYRGYAVFGRVIQGMDVVDRIAQQRTETHGSFEHVPVEPVIIRSIRIRK